MKKLYILLIYRSDTIYRYIVPHTTRDSVIKLLIIESESTKSNRRLYNSHRFVHSDLNQHGDSG